MNERNTTIKKITFQILRAENLVQSVVQKNKSNKWRVIIVCGKKKYMTELVKCFEGHPYWNSEVKIKLTPDLKDPIVLIVADDSNNQYGQVVIPLNQIQPNEKSATNSDPNSAVLHSNELEPNNKCSNPTGSLFYRIKVLSDKTKKDPVNYKKRHSLFGLKLDPKQSRSPEFRLNHYDSHNIPKRLSLFKSQEKINELTQNRSKAKSMANIYSIKDNDHDHTSDSDSQKHQFMFPDPASNQVIRDFNWIRVEDVVHDKCKYNYDSNSIYEGEQEKVEVLSVQPDHGPITGNFTVVMEGSNFTSGLFDLTYIIIDGLEPIDATSCTNILSDTELLLTMPPISIPGMVNIHLELLDGSRISCAKTFYYIDSAVDNRRRSVLTPQPFDNQDEDLSVDGKLFDQNYDMLSSSMNSYRNFKSDANMVFKTDCAIDCLNEYDCRKLSDYGSQGSVHSDRDKMKNMNSSKLQPNDEVDSLRKENSDLRMQLNDFKSLTTGQILALQCQLKSRESEIDDISRTLCNLKMRLLEDGITKYLELH